MKKNELIPTTMRLPDDLRKWLKIRAITNNRSLNGEVIEIFEREKQRDEIEHDKQQK